MPNDPQEKKKTLKEQRKNAAAALFGRVGGLVGGIARAQKLTPSQRSEIASKAAKARWNKPKPE